MENSRMHSRNGLTRIGAAVSGAVFCCVAALAQSGSMQSGSMQQQGAMQNQNMSAMQNQNMNAGQPSPQDLQFLKAALQGNMAEIKTAHLVLKKSSNPDVKAFAERMITDHTMLLNKMKPIALQLGVAMPSGPDKQDAMAYQKLQALSGQAFDQQYVKDMLKDHKMDDSAFQMEISDGQDAVVKNAASSGDKVIESHLREIKGIAQKMNISEGM